MPWLVVLGEGSWRSGPHWYKAGVHEVPREVADLAREDASRGVGDLRVLEERPEIEEHAGPLTLEDLRAPSRGVRLARPEVELAAPPVSARTLDYLCGLCAASFPSQGALTRHVEFHHGVDAVS